MFYLPPLIPQDLSLSHPGASLRINEWGCWVMDLSTTKKGFLPDKLYVSRTVNSEPSFEETFGKRRRWKILLLREDEIIFLK